MKSINSAIIILIISSLLLFLSSCNKEDNEEPNAPLSTYINIPDDNFERNLIRQGLDSDSTVNQRILRSDVKDLRRLDLNAVQMTFKVLDLTGIEGFSNLRYLNASGQKLQKVNLSNNKLLDTLFLNRNEIRTIDLSQNRKLRHIYLSDNYLTKVNGLQQAKMLKKVYLSFNDLESLFIDNKSVEYISASHNQISNINIEKAISLKTLFMPVNQLSSINLSKNLLLKELILSDNSIQHLNVSQNQNLEVLYCSSSALTSLDVSNNSTLYDLRVDRNPNLNCIKIDSGQQFATIRIDDHQALNTTCQ